MKLRFNDIKVTRGDFFEEKKMHVPFIYFAVTGYERFCLIFKYKALRDILEVYHYGF